MEKAERLSKIEFIKELLSLATQNNPIFNEKTLYKQVDGVTSYIFFFLV